MCNFAFVISLRISSPLVSVWRCFVGGAWDALSIPKLSYKFSTRGGSLDVVPHPLSLWERVTVLTIYSCAQSVGAHERVPRQSWTFGAIRFRWSFVVYKIILRVYYMKRVYRLTFCFCNVMLGKIYIVLWNWYAIFTRKFVWYKLFFDNEKIAY